LGNPLSKWQVGCEFNFDGINFQQRGGNFDLSFSGVAPGPCPPPTPTCPSSDKAGAVRRASKVMVGTPMGAGSPDKI
jgi:hypothetical protein